MKRILSMALMCALAGNLFAQTLIKETREVPDFSGLDASGVFVIELKKGPTSSVVIEAESKYMEYIKTEVRSGVLRIYGRWPESMRINNNANLKATITVSELNSLALSGVCSLTTTNLFTPSRFHLDLSGVSKVSGLRIEADEANMDISGASKINLSGSIKQGKIDLSGASHAECNLRLDQLSVDVSGTSKLELQGQANKVKMDISGVSSVTAASFPIKELDFSASGVGKADVQVIDVLSVRLSGTSRLNYKGKPRVDELKVSSGSSVNGQKGRD